ncbi:hypothetical protein L7F22_035699 [Adiantum nelumboides]|nr:hypothetical protein [Adiantum nelumboides]
MADNNKENRMSIDDFDFAHEDANDDTSMLVNYLLTWLHQAMGNPALQGEVQQQLHAYGILPPIQQERDPERFQGEISKRGLSMEKGVENPYQELKQLLEGKPSSKKKGHAQHERSPSREREESEPSNKSMEDVAPRRRRAQRSPTPTKRKRSLHSPQHCESKREEKNSKKKKKRKRSPSSPSSSPSSSLDEGSGYSSQERQRRGHQRSYAAWKRSSKLKKFKEGGKNISFLTYDEEAEEDDEEEPSSSNYQNDPKFEVEVFIVKCWIWQIWQKVSNLPGVYCEVLDMADIARDILCFVGIGIYCEVLDMADMAKGFQFASCARLRGSRRGVGKATMERKWWATALADVAFATDAVGIVAIDRTPPPAGPAATPSAGGAGPASRPQPHVAASGLAPRNCGIHARSCPASSANP